jgi:hypothetical protein
VKRKITVTTDTLRIVAVIDSRKTFLSREAVERVRNQLADTLQQVASEVEWIGTPRHKVVVR